MAQLITVMGGTGNVGRALVERLLENGVKVRAIARSSEKLIPLAVQGAEAIVGYLEDLTVLARSFQDADAVFAMIPQHFDVRDYKADQRRMVEGVIAALEASGVSHVVALSTNVAAHRIGPPAVLAEFEERLRMLSGVSVNILHPVFYMENHLASIPMIRNAGIIGGAIRGDVALPMISTRDVAAFAAEYLTKRLVDGCAVCPLYGPRDYTFPEASAILGAAINKPDLPYVEFSYDDFRKGLIEAGFSSNGADTLLELARAYNDGVFQNESRRARLNTTPTTLETFAREIFAPAYRFAEVDTAQ